MTNKELQQQIEQLEQQIKDLKVKLESKVQKEPYEVKVPDDIETYYTINARGELQRLNFYPDFIQEQIFKRGEAFEISDNAILYGKEKLLLKKMEDWAEEQNEGWTPNWNDFEEKQYYVVYDYEDKQFYVRFEYYSEAFTKLPYFKSYNLAEQFIEEFGEEIKEVLC